MDSKKSLLSPCIKMQYKEDVLEYLQNEYSAKNDGRLLPGKWTFQFGSVD